MFLSLRTKAALHLSPEERALHCSHSEHSSLLLYLNCSPSIILITWCILVLQAYLIWSIFLLQCYGIASIFFLSFQFTTSTFIPSHVWRSCTPEHAISAAPVILSPIFKVFSILFYLLNCSLSNIRLLCMFCSALRFRSRKSYLLLTASLCQMQHSSCDFTENTIYATNNLVSFSIEKLDLQVSRYGCINSLCSIQMISKEHDANVISSLKIWPIFPSE